MNTDAQAEHARDVLRQAATIMGACGEYHVAQLLRDTANVDLFESRTATAGWSQLTPHSPADHGPEFWSSGCAHPVCIAERQRILRPEWLRLYVPEYKALEYERAEIMRRLHERIATFDDDAYTDGEWEPQAAAWAYETVQTLRLIVGIKA